MPEDETRGLREHKKRATLNAIELGAIELSLKHGYDHVTVEMICKRAMISQRTFFNYVGSKERAVLGAKVPLPSETLCNIYIAGMGSSPLRDLVSTLTKTFADAAGTHTELFQKRRRLVQNTPELAIKEFARMEKASTSIIELVTERLKSDAVHKNCDTEEYEDEARMIVALTFCIMHYLIQNWVLEGISADTIDVLTQSFNLAQKIIDA